jgi:UDP-N-acetylmuramoyl-L-alanyl-D-glutamate--2,6-diaminopimelate ligase
VKGSIFQLEFMGNRFFVETPLVGGYQGENIALAAGILMSNGISSDDVIQGVWNLKLVPGRMESVEAGQPFEVFVDYSHTARSLWNAINTLRPLTSGKVISVFGCSGDRDQTKRPQMGKVVAEHADVVIITSDNPRFEDPASIIDQVYNGIQRSYRSKTTRIVDRAEAIYTAMKKAEPGDTVLISGKGAETVQKIADDIIDFDDRIVARQALKMVGWDND